MHPITRLTHGPVGLMKSLQFSSHQICLAVSWLTFKQMQKYSNITVHMNIAHHVSA